MYQEQNVEFWVWQGQCSNVIVVVHFADMLIMGHAFHHDLQELSFQVWFAQAAYSVTHCIPLFQFLEYNDYLQF